MNKLLGNLSTLLFSPDIPGEAASSTSGAGVSSVPGKSVGAAPEGDNFYANSPVDDGKVTKGDLAKEDFTAETPEDKSKTFTPIGEQQGEQKLDDQGQPIVEVPVAQAQPQLLKLDPETIAALRQQGQPATPAKPNVLQLTPQQLREKLNPVEVSADTLKSFGFEAATPEQVAGFQSFSNSIVKNAVSIARIMIEQKTKEFEQALGPIYAEREQAQLANAKTSFYEANKDLAKYEKIVQVAASEVSPKKADGSFKSDKEIMTEVATLARTTLASYGITLSTPANLSASGANRVPSPNRLSPNGRSGGDNNGQQGKANNPDADIYAR